MRPLRTAALALMLLPLAAQAAAQLPDSAQMAAARRVLAASGASELMISSIRTNLQAQKVAMPEVPVEFWSEFEARVVAGAGELTDSIAVP